MTTSHYKFDITLNIIMFVTIFFGFSFLAMAATEIPMSTVYMNTHPTVGPRRAPRVRGTGAGGL